MWGCKVLVNSPQLGIQQLLRHAKAATARARRLTAWESKQQTHLTLEIPAHAHRSMSMQFYLVLVTHLVLSLKNELYYDWDPPFSGAGIIHLETTSSVASRRI